jgi:hypothetical protein
LCILATLGFELRALCLLGRCSTVRATPTSLFALVILEIVFCFLPRLAWTSIFLSYASHCSWDDKHVPPGPAFFSIEIGPCEPFCLGWPGTTILPISASQVVMTIGVSH